MTSSADPVPVDLTDRERDFIFQALEQWALAASVMPFPYQVLGLSTWDEFGELTFRLGTAVVAGEPLNDLDWARVLFLTECSWASETVGAGRGFASVTGYSDVEAVGLLRGLQRKIGGIKRAKLLFPHGGRPQTAQEIEERKRWLEQLRRDQQDPEYPPGL
ncbi:hypothetical protein BN971_01105 [Mycobacterium bohemicum DSM 44277]|uniref:Uncharacterized protein n=2 Tax=Mycobacterium bohemicum TaxID=56425 RepID=A0A1X1R7X5_MYCBE|nr:hypothetical protein [Mycobacterium bohemicum]MCV6969266.1 hypothetical protein [Mycobacterium bohemicum]ORV01045.1 hypothetical protein AWB93_07880 [Mycobacterium bohemicum]CPR07815.1 hypothetical protein BN971_01105 [Mycobacterium bohemicum DSM 44277]